MQNYSLSFTTQVFKAVFLIIVINIITYYFELLRLGLFINYVSLAQHNPVRRGSNREIFKERLLEYLFGLYAILEKIFFKIFENYILN